MQYAPYALFLAAVSALLAGGVIYTSMVLRRNDKRCGEKKVGAPKI